MKRIARVAVVASAFVLFAGAARATDAPAVPDDAVTLAPATIAYAALMDRHRAAVGDAVPGAYSFERWRVKLGDLDGTSTFAKAGDDYRDDTTLGPVHHAYGRSGASRWSQNPNGITRAVQGIHDGSDDVGSASPAVLGSNAGLHAYVVRTGPPDYARYTFYDQTTALVVRTERVENGQSIATIYDDFATQDGRTRARHIKTTDGQKFGTYEEWLVSATVSATVDRAALAIPVSRALLAIPNGRVRLPAHIASDRIIVETKLGNRKINLQMDSGASTVLLDRDIVEALGMTEYGHTTQTVAGTFVARQALIPSLAIGPLTFDRLFVESGPADFSIDADTPVAGLLGSDFLSSCTIAIDYAGGTVDAIDSATFAMPKDAIVLPARFDDGVPTIEASVGGAVSRTFILDTGADRSMLFEHFVASHPHETADRRLGAQESAASPYSPLVGGVGGRISVRTIEASDFRLGSIAFARWPFYAVSSGQHAFEGDDYDGLIGQDVLRYFTVYLDYPHGRVAFVPNARYAARFL